MPKSVVPFAVATNFRGITILGAQKVDAFNNPSQGMVESYRCVFKECPSAKYCIEEGYWPFVGCSQFRGETGYLGVFVHV